MKSLISRVNLATQVYELLKRRIITNQLSFGYKMAECHLAEELGISRTPVREALNRLIQDNLVTVIPGRGAFVRSFSLDDIVEFLEVREAVEGVAARLAASRITKESLAGLRSHLAAGAMANEENGYSRYLEADREFHEALALASGNLYLSQFVRGLREKIQSLRSRSVIIPGRARKSFQEHLEIIKALSRRDPDLAEERMRTHIQNVKADLKAAMVGHDSSPEPRQVIVPLKGVTGKNRNGGSHSS